MRVEKRYKKKRRNGDDNNNSDMTGSRIEIGGESYFIQNQIKNEIDELDKFIQDLIVQEEKAEPKPEIKKQEIVPNIKQ